MYPLASCAGHLRRVCDTTRYACALPLAAGLRYSVHEDSFTFADNLPGNWSFMEFRVPVLKQAPGPATAVTWARPAQHSTTQFAMTR